MIWPTIFLGLTLQVLLVFGARYPKNLHIWPMPESVEYGNKTIFLSKDFQLKTDGSKYADASGILKDGFTRLLDVITASNVIESNFSKVDESVLLQGVHVIVLSKDDELQYGVDESYELSIHPKGKPIYANIKAATVYGALHALQTFSQLCHFNLKRRKLEVSQIPWTITDRPRFAFRGLLIDTSRHYQPLPMIKKVIDSMAYAKLNVLHWHIVDTQSFPLEIPSYPKLWDGAYSLSERYTVAVAADIVKQVKEPLDISNAFTFKLIDGVLSDFSKIFKYKFVHLGGDEVDTSCWSSTPHIKEWLKQQGLNASQAYEYFVLNAQKIALLGSGVAERVVAAGLRCIVSNQDAWYLDHLSTTWQEFYTNEPLTNITNPTQQKLVIGGEVCMWGEHIDGSDIEQTIWPRAAAAAERLWTHPDKLAKTPKDVTSRLSHFRCLLNQRGVAAAPLDGPGRVAPIEPGSCYTQ
ncbi:Beta-hexosaminidase subunit alpha/beta [Cynara cardunculus var. scolymus]|uniref:beta-N-acetylhexosaminidase n=1 Tax=Cynara cardunculus var. scolymus TaxID=59895 RepID=A0A103YI72_CYNCS|nr:Beta-hexosaminidase subunit alpha/beta [Cynara cardunculus var. scolymus]